MATFTGTLDTGVISAVAVGTDGSGQLLASAVTPAGGNSDGALVLTDASGNVGTNIPSASFVATNAAGQLVAGTSITATSVTATGLTNAGAVGTDASGLLVVSSTNLLATITLSSSQLLSLSTTPVVLVPAPGAGLYLFPHSYMLEYNFGGTAYSTPAPTNNCWINWGGQAINSSNGPMSFDWGVSFIKSSSSVLALGVCGNGLISLAVAENNSLMFGAPNPLSNGNGTLKVSLTYSILSV